MIQEFMAAAQSVKVLNDIVQGSLELKKFNDLALAVSKANESLLSAQTAAMKAQAEQAALTEKIRQLEHKIMNMENWETQKQNYRLQSVAPDVFAYVYAPTVETSEPTHWLCCNCFHENKKSILQLRSKVASGNFYVCHSCNSDILIPKEHTTALGSVLGRSGSWRTV